MLRRKHRVRMHLMEDQRQAKLPSIEGLLVSRRDREYMIAVPSLLWTPEGKPDELESRWLRIPRERVAFYEVLS